MKKVLFIFFLLLILFCLKNQDNTELVFQEINYDRARYCIDVKNENVTTNNINEIFNNIEIISVYPYFNNSYKKLLNNLDFVTLDNINLYYRDLLKQLGKYNWVSNYYEGIKLEKIKIYAFENEVEALFSKHKFFKVCDTI